MGAESLELYVDNVTREKLVGVWRAFFEAGIPSSWREEDSPWPHITVGAHFASQGIEVDINDGQLSEACAAACGVSFALTSLGMFAHKKTSVLYFTPAPNIELLSAYERIMAALPPATKPIREHWTPHCTLSQRLPYNQLLEAIEIARAVELPIVGSIERVVYKTAGIGNRTTLGSTTG